MDRHRKVRSGPGNRPCHMVVAGTARLGRTAHHPVDSDHRVVAVGSTHPPGEPPEDGLGRSIDYRFGTTSNTLVRSSNVTDLQ